MSFYEYQESRTLTAPFYALIMGAMRGADTANAEKLRAAFPEAWDELRARYDAPGGLLPGEVNYDAGIQRADDGAVYDLDGNLLRSA